MVIDRRQRQLDPSGDANRWTRARRSDMLARHWGNGYGTEACRALLRELVVDRSAHRVVAHCDPRNTRSWALLERLGFRREAHLRSAASFQVDDAGRRIWHDTFGYGLLAGEWERAAVGWPRIARHMHRSVCSRVFLTVCL
ncbi:hypothetical protein BH11ACT1_BH11ACT1_02070 [soil metagenome]